MGQYTAEELNNLTNAVLDFHMKGPAKSQIDQSRPLYDALQAGKKSFPASKEFIDGPVKGQYTSAMVGYSHDDDQSYSNPTNIKRWQAKWYEVSSGIKVTFTELKAAGIHVVDRKTTNQSSGADMVVLTNIWEDKLQDLNEGSKRSLAEMFWRDGTQDAKAIPGILSFILDSPTTGTTFGLDRAANSWWRNRASLLIDTSTASNLNLVTKLQQEFRQLRRYGNPKHKFFAGSDFLDAFEKELRSKGNFTLEGWSKQGRIDASVADLSFKGVDIVYEPLLDDLSRSKYGYVLDMNAIKLMPMEGEDMILHTPERPAEKYVIYRALTMTGALTANCLNTSGCYSIL